MSESLNIRLSDDAYAELCRKADATAAKPSELATRTLEEKYAPSGTSQGTAGVDSDPETARERFQRHFGSLDLGHPTGAGNRSIDADLAKEYSADAKET